MPKIVHDTFKPTAAIEAIRKKLKIPTERWDDYLNLPRSKVFTIAGATKLELLNDFHAAVDKAISEGQSYGKFVKQFDSIVKKHGWSYKGERGWRSRVIYNTNMRTAYAAGRWQGIQKNKKYRPWLIYKTMGDKRVRTAHQAWNNVALSVDNPAWDTHYPPNGWLCRCTVRTASNRDLKRLNIQPQETLKIEREQRINRTTKKNYGLVPKNIDTGWDINHGKSWLGSDIAFGEKLMNLPKPILQDVIKFNADTKMIKSINASWQSWLIARSKDSKANNYTHPIGFMNADTIDYVRSNNDITNALIVVRDEHIKGISRAVRNNLPKLIADPKAVLVHNSNKNIVVVVKSNKVIGKKEMFLHVDYSKSNRLNFISRSTKSIDLKDYKVIKGKL